MLLVNKQYTPKDSTWENIKEAYQWIYTYIQNIKSSFNMLYNLLYTLCVKQDYKYYIYKQNSRPYFRGICLNCRLGGKSCKEVYTNSVLLFYQLIRIQDNLLRLKLVIPQGKKYTQLASISNPARMLTKKV